MKLISEKTINTLDNIYSEIIDAINEATSNFVKWKCAHPTADESEGEEIIAKAIWQLLKADEVISSAVRDLDIEFAEES